VLRVIVFVCLVRVCCQSAPGQTRLEVEANVILPDGRRSLVVTNHGERTVTAFAYEYRVSVQDLKPVREQVRGEFKDSALYPSDPVIEPGKDAAVAVGVLPAAGQRVLNSPPELRAAVFDDGSSFGDPSWVARIRDRRLVMIETLDAEIEVLADPARAIGLKGTRRELAAKLGNAMPGWMKADADPEHQRIIQGQYDALSRNLAETHQSMDGLRRLIQAQRDKAAKAAGIMHPAKLLEPATLRNGR
jgi:hypothetical protein